MVGEDAPFPLLWCRVFLLRNFFLVAAVRISLNSGLPSKTVTSYDDDPSRPFSGEGDCSFLSLRIIPFLIQR